MPDADASFLGAILDSNFMPHGYCLSWQPDILWTHVVSDAVIALAYVSIPVTLIYFARHRRDLPAPGLFMMFGAFILACAVTHVMGMVTLWNPVYRLEGLFKAGTAIISAGTAVALVRAAPALLALRSPAELEAANAALQEQVVQRKQAEQEARDAGERLEERVKQRTKELRLRNAQLAESNRELDEFAHVASHDLKAPLRAVSNLANWIEEDSGDGLTADSRADFKLLHERIDRMDGLLDSLLEYSRAGRLRAQAEEFSTAEVFEEIVAMLAPPPGAEIRAAGELPTLHTSRDPFAKVLRNLISNAVRHHDRDDPKIEVSHRILDGLVEFTVADDGPGIPPEYQEQIFQMFETLKPRDEVESTGIGLAIVKKTVESFGGAIRVESAEGQGARFIFSWPERSVTEPEMEAA